MKMKRCLCLCVVSLKLRVGTQITGQIQVTALSPSVRGLIGLHNITPRAQDARYHSFIPRALRHLAYVLSLSYSTHRPGGGVPIFGGQTRAI